jgi:uncharacterized SAM-binding protein YcdF (DUF218 family)
MKTFFIAKKLAGAMLMPLQFSLVLLVSGAILLWLNRGQRLAKCLVTVGTGLLLIFSNTFVGYHLAHDLEARYPPLRLARLGQDGASAVQHLLIAGKANPPSPALGQDPFIFVLSGGASDDPALPEADRLSSGSALRVAEAVEIYRSLASSSPGAAKAGQRLAKDEPDDSGSPRLILSGGPTVNRVPEAIPMQKLAESLGIPPKAIVLETNSDDTFHEAKDILPLVGHQPFLLVTSAVHMPRAVALFRHQGMRPIAAPANYIGRWTTKPFVMNIPPDVDALMQSDAAWHERLGMLWEHLRGQL